MIKGYQPEAPGDNPSPFRDKEATADKPKPKRLQKESLAEQTHKTVYLNAPVHHALSQPF